MLAILLGKLIPIVGCLSGIGLPLGLYYISKSHKLRMKELELEALRTPLSTDQRLLAIEERLAGIEGALTGRPALPSAQERAALLEGPPDAARLRTR